MTQSIAESSIESIKIAFLIMACNEEPVIQKTIRSVKNTIMPSDALIVVADNCDDATALISKENGADVLLREERASTGKSAALLWLVNQHTPLLQSFDFVVILDADSIVSRDFSLQLKKHLSATDQAIQCKIIPIEFQGSPISTLSALSEIIEQTTFQRLRTWLGLSVRLRGTGMVFRSEILIRFVPKLQTYVEDIALSLLLVEGKMAIHSFNAAVIYDPKPIDHLAASRQRARWFRGQWASLWKFRRTVINLIFRGPDGWSMLGAIFLKPRWLKIVLLLILGIVFYQNQVISAVCLLLVLFDFILIGVGLALLSNPAIFLKSLNHLPGFLVMWVKGILLSFKSKSWLRVREIKNTENQIFKD
jgi:cellulose synthase/poly-beta-1,6-N-acetylglucosamine synthase-like glycosyltransferase